MKHDRFIALLELIDEGNVELGRESASEHIEKLRIYLDEGGDLDGVTLGFQVAARMARHAVADSIRQSATKRKITPERYFAAEVAGRGKKLAMATMLGVSEEGLTKYEKKNEAKLDMLRPDAANQTRQHLLDLLIALTPTT